jgi:hypothetical protein
MALISKSPRRLERITFVCLINIVTIYHADLFSVFFGHLTPAVEDLRHKHVYQPTPVEQRSPALAIVLQEIQNGRFGDGGVYES